MSEETKEQLAKRLIAEAAEELRADETTAALEICDAVLQWLVRRGLADAGTEYQASEVIEILDSLLTS